MRIHQTIVALSKERNGSQVAALVDRTSSDGSLVAESVNRESHVLRCERGDDSRHVSRRASRTAGVGEPNATILRAL
jgi:hypothetical protein